jgi:hypothetical protein
LIAERAARGLLVHMSAEKKHNGKKEDELVSEPLAIPERSSPLRFMMAATDGENYQAFKSLAEARTHPDAAMIMEADSGGQILVTCPVSKVQADEDVLLQLLCDLETITWGPGGLSETSIPCDACIYYEPLPSGSGVSGGMGGGCVLDGPWLHGVLEELGLRHQIEEILAGKRKRLQPQEGVKLTRR